MKLFFCVIGMVMIFEGLPYFAFPGKTKEMILMMAGLEDNRLRRFGFILMALGLLIVYLAMGNQ